MDTLKIGTIFNQYKEACHPDKDVLEEMTNNAIHFFINAVGNNGTESIETLLFEMARNGEHKNASKQIVSMYHNSTIMQHKAKLLSKIMVLPKDDSYFELFKQELSGNEHFLIKLISAIGVLHYVSPYEDLLDVNNLYERKSSLWKLLEIN